MRQHSSASRLRLQAGGHRRSKGLTPQALLGLHPFFSTLAPGDVLKFLARTHCRSVSSGRTIFRKDDPGDGLYGVLAGNVAFAIGSRDGKDLILNALGPGEFFGEIALLDGGGRSATALARSDCRLLFIPRREFLSFFAERSDAMMQIIALLCARLRRSTDYIADSTFLGFSPRLAKQLIFMLGEAVPAPHTALRISQAELASMLGVSRERVNRQLVAWANSGILDQRRGRVVVRDRRALEHVIANGA
jgi:CRP/FNR family transcriptional regulator, cyclic AMP receptor protein